MWKRSSISSSRRSSFLHRHISPHTFDVLHNITTVPDLMESTRCDSREAQGQCCRLRVRSGARNLSDITSRPQSVTDSYSMVELTLQSGPHSERTGRRYAFGKAVNYQTGQTDSALIDGRNESSWPCTSLDNDGSTPVLSFTNHSLPITLEFREIPANAGGVIVNARIPPIRSVDLSLRFPSPQLSQVRIFFTFVHYEVPIVSSVASRSERS